MRRRTRSTYPRMDQRRDRDQRPLGKCLLSVHRFQQTQGLDAYQAYLILEMLHGDKVDTSTDLLEKVRIQQPFDFDTWDQAKELYLAERCAQLICISAVFEKRLKSERCIV